MYQQEIGLTICHTGENNNVSAVPQPESKGSGRKPPKKKQKRKLSEADVD